MQIRPAIRTAALCGAAISHATACNKKADNTSNFTSAINTYYSAHPACLWSDPIKFPVQADTSNASKTSGYDALVDQGLLVRTTAERKVMIIASKQVNNYDLSDKGRTAWTADPNQPGYGNFCFGHREVTSIDSFTPPDANATQYAVNYHYAVTGVPDWASTAEMKTGFPTLAADTSGQQTATATLVKSDKGWQVTGVQPGGTDSGTTGL